MYVCTLLPQTERTLEAQSPEKFKFFHSLYLLSLCIYNIMPLNMHVVGWCIECVGCKRRKCVLCMWLCDCFVCVLLFRTTYHPKNLIMGAYKYMEEVWRHKQSDVMRFLLRIRAWEYRQRPRVVRLPQPTRPEKARKLGYKAKQVRIEPSFYVWKGVMCEVIGGLEGVDEGIVVEGSSICLSLTFVLFFFGCDRFFDCFVFVFACVCRVTSCSDVPWREEAESDLMPEVLCSESPSTTVSTSWSSPETFNPWLNSELADDAATCECWTLTGWTRTVPTSTTRWFLWTLPTMPSETMPTSTGSATLCTNTERCEVWLLPAERAEVSETRDTRPTTSREAPLTPLGRTETLSSSGDTDKVDAELDREEGDFDEDVGCELFVLWELGFHVSITQTSSLPLFVTPRSHIHSPFMFVHCWTSMNFLRVSLMAVI